MPSPREWTLVPVSILGLAVRMWGTARLFGSLCSPPSRVRLRETIADSK